MRTKLKNFFITLLFISSDIFFKLDFAKNELSQIKQNFAIALPKAMLWMTYNLIAAKDLEKQIAISQNQYWYYIINIISANSNCNI